MGRRAANACYLLAVVAINFTLFRPSPVDILFVTALLLSISSRQIVTRNMFIFLTLIGVWVFSLYTSSISLVANPEVAYYLLKISFAVSIGVCSSLIAAHWDAADLRRFLQVFVLATSAAATLGIAGYILGIEELMWDGRAKGFLDDPNMYGAFLLPGILACMYMLSKGERRGLYGPALAWIAFGLIVSFSRAAIVSGLLWGGVYYVFLNRRNLARASLYAGLGVAALCLLVLLGVLFVDGLGERLAERSTIAKEYDLGHGGRYSRYALSIPFILDNPFSMGLLEWERFFEEPIHNIWVSSFLNYGWLAGIAFTLLLMFSVSISARNFRQTGNEALLAVTVAWVAVISCAFLHEAERWRHLWMFTGLVWGLNARNFMPAGQASREEFRAEVGRGHAPSGLVPSPARA
ncbi:hypothetical protein HJG44_06470 [Enterovirga sp. DB1703]|uniref:O-antigen ligase family protein n=1 Tax=Enterovirga aerilata TaxID=2730920 RepID=A0A849I7N8_9HYPH|nr:hypothetical protein [Enterovirga sp. DB1703]